MLTKPFGKDPWVLVVDDDVDIRMSIMMIVQHRSIIAIGASDGLDAIKILVTALKIDNLPKIMFLDLNMPHFSGWEILELIAVAQPKIHKLNVVLITGEKIPNDEHYRVLPKPFNIDDVIAELDRVF